MLSNEECAVLTANVQGVASYLEHQSRVAHSYAERRGDDELHQEMQSKLNIARGMLGYFQDELASALDGRDDDAKYAITHRARAITAERERGGQGAIVGNGVLDVAMQNMLQGLDDPVVKALLVEDHYPYYEHKQWDELAIQLFATQVLLPEPLAHVEAQHHAATRHPHPHGHASDRMPMRVIHRDTGEDCVVIRVAHRPTHFKGQ